MEQKSHLTVPDIVNPATRQENVPIILTDPSWGKGELRIVVLALADMDGAIWRFFRFEYA